ncbi:hypothetical protein CTAYLR_007219 [Chrysophaeum taylorii]|uniref:Transmembrane protein 107 n=1 Tax=Chrysophaeum taylorii TaxID=2483200 RepID=A0AAD7XKB8_9STRA|nr:hypothetical protein CTAYLR_007219 [Chrysophaeum taylorii]
MIVSELVPTRFVLLTFHGVMLVSYYYLKVDAIEVTLEPASRRTSQAEINKAYRHAVDRVDVVIFWSWACMVVEYVGLWSAYSLSWPRLTLYNVVCHACGTLLALWSQLDAWSYVASEYNFVLFTFFPAILELCVVAWTARAHRRELAAFNGDPPGTPSKLVLDDAQLFIVLAALVLGLVGLPLAARFVHRSLKTGRLLGVGGWFGLIFSIISPLLLTIVANQKLGFLDSFQSARAKMLRRQDSETQRPLNSDDDDDDDDSR